MSAKSTPAPIIVIKRKKIINGHHGGAWKVAYADFVTAMMALFIVLWLLNSDEKVQGAVGGYFRDPTGTGKQIGSAVSGTGESMLIAQHDMNKIKEKLEAELKKMPEFDEKIKDQVDLTITGEGLRIELLENAKGLFFESGSPVPTKMGEQLMAALAKEIGKLPNSLLMEGHTDARAFNGSGTYSNWELSADRANAARRLMQTVGLQKDQVAQVRGFAAQQLRRGAKPEDPSNRRISVVVQYTPEQIKEYSARNEPKAGKGAKSGGHGAPSAKPAGSSHH
jgi:chemotaxis protein MotB